MPLRTPSGGPSEAAREEYGNKRGAFPIFDRQSAESALRLRGKAKSKAERKNIIVRARKYMPEMAKAAWEMDSKAGVI